MNEDEEVGNKVIAMFKLEQERKRLEKLKESEEKYRGKLNELKAKYLEEENSSDMKQVTIVVHFDDKDEAELFYKRVKRMNTIDGKARPVEEVMFYPTTGKIIKLSIAGPND